MERSITPIMEKFVNASGLGDTFPAYSYALSNIWTGEVALRHRDEGGPVVRWTVLDSALRVSQAFSVTLASGSAVLGAIFSASAP